MIVWSLESFNRPCCVRGCSYISLYKFGLPRTPSPSRCAIKCISHRHTNRSVCWSFASTEAKLKILNRSTFEYYLFLFQLAFGPHLTTRQSLLFHATVAPSLSSSHGLLLWSKCLPDISNNNPNIGSDIYNVSNNILQFSVNTVKTGCIFR